MKNFGEKGAWGVPLLSQEWVRTSNLAGIFKGPSEQKSIKNFGEKERGHI